MSEKSSREEGKAGAGEVAHAPNSKAPWHASYGESGLRRAGDVLDKGTREAYVAVLDATRRIVARVRIGKTTRARDVADACLMAAAPDLLAALRECIDLAAAMLNITGDVAHGEAVRRARAAIAKAETGREPDPPPASVPSPTSEEK